MAAANAERIVSLHESGWSYGDPAESFGSTRSAIAGLIWRARNPHKRTNGRGRYGKRGEESRCAKLSEDQVRRIRFRWNSGETQISLAREYGVHQSQICLICAGKAWAHVQ